MGIMIRGLIAFAIVLGIAAEVHGQEKPGPAPTQKTDDTKGNPARPNSKEKKQNPSDNAKEKENQDDPASKLTLHSVWRGDRWRGQNEKSMEGPQPSNDVRVTMREGNKVTLTATKWAGRLGQIHWTLSIDGNQLKCTNVSMTGGGQVGTFDNISGSGTINAGVLQFACSAHQKSPKYNGVVIEKFELKLAP